MGIEAGKPPPHTEAVFTAQTDGHDPILDGFLKASEEERLRFEPKPFSVYFQDVLHRLKKDSSYNPYPNAAEVVHTMINVKSSDSDSLAFFTKRDDGNEVIGNTYALSLIASFIRSQALHTGPSRMLLLVAPTGAGKSIIANAITSGLEQYSYEVTDPIVGIAGCPKQENPLHLLPPQIRKSLRKEYGITIDADLCAHCQRMLAEQYANKREDVKVQAVRYSTSLGAGIAKIDPKMTRSQSPDAQEIIDRAVLGANRGILELPEFLHHSWEFLSILNDLLREGKWQYQGEQSIDALIVGHATLASFLEMDKLPASKLDVNALKQRMEVVFIRYSLSVSDEETIYKKLLSQGKLRPHISPQTLESIAKVAVLSRLKPSSTAGVTPEIKMDLYDGKDTENFQQKHRKSIEEEGRAKNEGFDGLSPTLIHTLLERVLVENGNCINPVAALGQIKTYIEMQPAATFTGKEDILKSIDTYRKRYDEWLEKTVRQAFRAGLEEAATQLFELYIEHILRKEENRLEYNPKTQEWEPADEAFIKDMEKEIKPEKETEVFFRRRVLNLLASKSRKGEKLTYREISEVKTGIEKKITGETEEEVESTILSLQGVPDEKQSKRLEEITACLAEKHGFCADCAAYLLRYTANIMRSKTASK